MSRYTPVFLGPACAPHPASSTAAVAATTSRRARRPRPNWRCPCATVSRALTSALLVRRRGAIRALILLRVRWPLPDLPSERRVLAHPRLPSAHECLLPAPHGL